MIGQFQRVLTDSQDSLRKMVTQRDLTALEDVLMNLKPWWKALLPQSCAGFWKEKEITVLSERQKTSIIDYLRFFYRQYILNHIKDVMILSSSNNIKRLFKHNNKVMTAQHILCSPWLLMSFLFKLCYKREEMTNVTGYETNKWMLQQF